MTRRRALLARLESGGIDTSPRIAQYGVKNPSGPPSGAPYIEDENYCVWSHVKNLGKRYECWVYVKDSSDVMNVSFAPLIEKYKKKQLEVSVNSSGCLRDGYSHSLMISSLWTTKGHKETKNG